MATGADMEPDVQAGRRAAHHPEGGDEISLVEIANALLRHWRLVVILPLAVGLLFGVMAMRKDRQFTASGSFVPQGAESRGPTGAAAIAQQFGFSLGGQRAAQSPQFYVDLLRSRAVLRQAAESEYQIPTLDGGVTTGTLAEFFEIEAGGASPVWLRTVEALRGRVSVSLVRETGVVHVSVAAPSPALAEQIVARLLEIVNSFNLEVRQEQARDEGRFIGDRLAEAQRELGEAEASLLEFMRRNREFRNAPDLIFEYDRLNRQVMMRQEVYTTLLHSREQTRIDGVRDTPLLTIIDQPAGSAQPQSRGTVFRGILGLVLGAFLAFGIILVLELGRAGRTSLNPDTMEFQNLLRQAWSDVRHPSRWFRRPGPATAGE